MFALPILADEVQPSKFQLAYSKTMYSALKVWATQIYMPLFGSLSIEYKDARRL